MRHLNWSWQVRGEFSVFPHSASETKIDFPRLVLESFGAGTSEAFAATFATIVGTDLMEMFWNWRSFNQRLLNIPNSEKLLPNFLDYCKIIFISCFIVPASAVHSSIDWMHFLEREFRHWPSTVVETKKSSQVTFTNQSESLLRVCSSLACRPVRRFALMFNFCIFYDALFCWCDSKHAT